MNKRPATPSIKNIPDQTEIKIKPVNAQNMGRRLMDNNGGLTKSPDRRIENAERRSLDAVSHSSPVRRYTIDRRSGIKDRRSAWNNTWLPLTVDMNFFTHYRS